MHTEDSGEKETSPAPNRADQGAESSGLQAARGADIPVPPSDLEPWSIPGVARLAEGHGKALILSRGEGRPVVEIILCRVDGVLRALDSECPHEGGRIQGGELVEGRYARCPLHWFDFDPADGRCVNVDCDPAGTYRVEERDSCALVWLID